jgi:hypothetical protein
MCSLFTSLLKLISVSITSSNESLTAFGMAHLTMYNISSSYTIPRVTNHVSVKVAGGQ